MAAHDLTHVPLFTAFAPPAIAFRLVAAEVKAVICDANQVHKLAAGSDMPHNPMWRVVVTGAGRHDGAIGFPDLMEGQQPGFSTNTHGGDAPLIQIYTSGTVGRPKGVVFPVPALAGHAYGEFGLGLTRDDLYWCAADPGWAYGLYFGVLGSLTIGVKSVLLAGGFSAERTFAMPGWKAVIVHETEDRFAAAGELGRVPMDLRGGRTRR